MFKKRWADLDFHEEGGESIRMTQQRNIECITEILVFNPWKSIVIGTHGTALSSILNYYDPSFGCDSFLRIIDWMPYIHRMDFERNRLLDSFELFHILKEYRG